MKKSIIVLGIVFFAMYSCSTDNDLEINKINFSLNFKHNWKDSITITNADFGDLKFINERNQKLSIERLRYLVSDVTLINQNGDTISSNDYHLIDVADNDSFTFTISEKVPVGIYSSIKFRFGFSAANNIDGAYPELNSANFNVPGMLGGGYHFMQFDGKYIDSVNVKSNFNYHMISAIDIKDVNNIKKTDTSFEVNLGKVIIEGNSPIQVKVDISQCFKNPNLWNLNKLNTVLMPNYEAQLKMSANGKNVFSLAK
jgi:hypothetical protein